MFIITQSKIQQENETENYVNIELRKQNTQAKLKLEVRAYKVLYAVKPHTGLLIFRTVAEPPNSGKSAKSRKIHKNTQNTAKFGKKLIK